MGKVSTQNVRIESLSIRNYKGIDKLELKFDLPQMPDKPDITMLGSKNGIGKTSVLECCVWLMLSGLNRDIEFVGRDLLTSLIRAGSPKAEISGEISVDGKISPVSITISADGRIKYSPNKPSEGDLREVKDWLQILMGESLNPLIAPKFLLLHSYRKVQEGNPELGMMVEDERNLRNPIARFRPSRGVTLSLFKKIILKSLMSEADLFERTSKDSSTVRQKAITILNSLLETYASVKIGKLRPFADNTIDIRVEPLSSGESFSFDGLSSGQKEIISTLFMIWSNTESKPSVVLIDEPELHLNVEWHRDFVKKLIELAPQNQYIIATHSEDIMGSVDKSQRVLLIG